MGFNLIVSSTPTSTSIYSLLLLKTKLTEKELEGILSIEVPSSNSETEEVKFTANKG